MKLKRFWLYVLITVLFVASFYVVNLRFDKFYRINGINNDNRVVLEEYLDKDEQEYLVENQINLDLFYDYITLDGFTLYNYQYYDLLKNNTSLSNSDIVAVGNRIQDRLSTLYSSKLEKYAKLLIENDLENAFLNNDNFNFDNINYYIILKDLYKSSDYSFIDDTDIYLEVFKVDQINEESYESTFKNLVTNYRNKTSIKAFMSESLLQSEHRVYNPSDLKTLLDDTTYIGDYEPNSLIMVSSIKRVKYATYVTDATDRALSNLNDAFSSENDGRLVIYNGYLSSTSIKDYLYRDFQLGTSVDLSLYEHNYSTFDETDASKWLEENAYKYGFVLRYPKNKASYTNQKYNSHIYKYVGKENSIKMHNNDLCFEEFVNESEE